MTLIGPPNVDERIDQSSEPWRDWGQMLRQHFCCLREIMEIIGPSNSMLDSIYCTRSLAKWMQRNTDQLSRVVCQENRKTQAYDIGVHFGSSPYGPEQPVPGIGVLYVDPLLEKTPLTWDMVDDRAIEVDGKRVKVDAEVLLRDPNECQLDTLWQQKIQEAEREWFSKSLFAPVAIVSRTRSNPKGPQCFDETYQWDATSDLLGVAPELRRQITGWHAAGPTPWFLDCIDEQLRNQPYPYNLELRIYNASQALIADRRAKLIDDTTPKVAEEHSLERLGRRL